MAEQVLLMLCVCLPEHQTVTEIKDKLLNMKMTSKKNKKTRHSKAINDCKRRRASWRSFHGDRGQSEDEQQPQKPACADIQPVHLTEGIIHH